MIPTRETPAPADFAPTPKRNHVMHAWLSAEIAIALEQEAKRRGLHPDALLAEVTTRLVKKRAFRAIVDRLFDET
jgi:hypothetical protein